MSSLDVAPWRKMKAAPASRCPNSAIAKRCVKGISSKIPKVLVKNPGTIRRIAANSDIPLPASCIKGLLLLLRPIRPPRRNMATPSAVEENTNARVHQTPIADPKTTKSVISINGIATSAKKTGIVPSFDWGSTRLARPQPLHKMSFPPAPTPPGAFVPRCP